jgi:hypothetical protein
MQHTQQAALLVDSLRRLKIPFDEALKPLEKGFQSWMDSQQIELTIPAIDKLKIVNIRGLEQYVDEHDDDFLETLSNCLNRLQNEKYDALDRSRGNLRTVDELAQIHQFVLNHPAIVFLDLSDNFFRHDCWDSIVQLLKIDSLQVLSVVRNPVVALDRHSRFDELIEQSPQLLMKLIWIPEFLVGTGFWNSALQPIYSHYRQLMYSIQEQHRRFFGMLAK